MRFLSALLLPFLLHSLVLIGYARTEVSVDTKLTSVNGDNIDPDQSRSAGQTFDAQELTKPNGDHSETRLESKDMVVQSEHGGDSVIPPAVPTEEPKAEDLKTEEPKAEDLKAEDLKTEDLKTEEPKTEDLKTEDLKTEEPKTEEPKTEEPKAEDLKAEDLKTEEPKAKEPKTEDLKTEDLKTEDLKTEDLKTEEPKAKEPKTEDLKTEEPKAKEPKAKVVSLPIAKSEDECDDLTAKQAMSNIIYYSMSNVADKAEKLNVFFNYQYTQRTIYTLLRMSDLESMLSVIDRSYAVDLNCLAAALLSQDIRLSSDLSECQGQDTITVEAIDRLLAKLQPNYLGFYDHQIQFLNDFKNAFFYHNVFLHADPTIVPHYFERIPKADIEVILSRATLTPKLKQSLDSKAAALLASPSVNISQFMSILVSSDMSLNDVKDIFVQKLTHEMLQSMPILVKKYVFLRYGLFFKYSAPAYDFVPELDLIVESFNATDIPLIDSLLRSNNTDVKQLVAAVIKVFEAVPGKKRLFLSRVDLRSAADLLDASQVKHIFFHAANLEIMSTLTADQFESIFKHVSKSDFNEADVQALSAYLKSENVLISSKVQGNPLYGVKFMKICSDALSSLSSDVSTPRRRYLSDNLLSCIPPLTYKTFSGLEPSDMLSAFLRSTSYDADMYLKLQTRDLIIMSNYVALHATSYPSSELTTMIRALSETLSKVKISIGVDCQALPRKITKSSMNTLRSAQPTCPLLRNVAEYLSIDA